MQRTGLWSICPGGQLEALARSACVTVGHMVLMIIWDMSCFHCFL